MYSTWKNNLFWKKCSKPRRHRPINGNPMLVRTMHPSTAVLRTRNVTNKQTNKLETKASSHAGQCIPAGSSVILPRRVLITMSIITMRSISAISASDCLRFAKSRPQFCESCGATYRRIWETFSALQGTSGPVTSRNSCWKQRPNRCIIGEAILLQTGIRNGQKRGSKFGALLWRHLTPLRKIAI